MVLFVCLRGSEDCLMVTCRMQPSNNLTISNEGAKPSLQLKVDPSVIVLAISYDDQWTNMVQPFWTIPLLAVAGSDMRKLWAILLLS